MGENLCETQSDKKLFYKTDKELKLYNDKTNNTIFKNGQKTSDSRWQNKRPWMLLLSMDTIIV